MIASKPKISYFSIRSINPVIRFLTLSDFMIMSAFGLISPIFAVFVIDNIEGGTIEIVGVGSAIYLLTKSIAQIPIGLFIDKIKGEKDDFWAMFIGSILLSLIPLLYLIITSPLHLFIVQFFYGLAAAITFPSWFAVFTRHIDRNKEGVEWGAYTTMVDMGAAATAGIGGFLATRFGFHSVFYVVSLLSLVGSMFLIYIYKNMKKGRVFKV